MIHEAESQGRLTKIPKSIDDIASSDYGFDDVENTTLSESIAESKIRSLISQILSESEGLIDEDLIETPDDDEVEEASVAGSIGGYVGPMASPANPKKFYKGMLKSYPGSHYVNDLPKSKI